MKHYDASTARQGYSPCGMPPGTLLESQPNGAWSASTETTDVSTPEELTGAVPRAGEEGRARMHVVPNR